MDHSGLRVLLLTAVPLALGTAAHAGPLVPSPTVRLVAPAGCPDQAALAQQIQQNVAGGGAQAAAAITARVTVTGPRDGAWVAEVRIEGAHGSGARRLIGASCREVVEAAALEIALALGAEDDAQPADSPAAVTVDPPASQVPSGAVDLVSSAPVTAGLRRVARPHAASPSRMRWTARADGLADAGSLPGATAGAAVALALGIGRARLEAWGGALASRSATLSGTSGAAIRLWVLGLRGCGQRGPLALCLGGEVGRMTARGTGLGNAHAGGAPWGAVSASAWWRHRLTRWLGFACGIQGLVPLARPRFVLDTGELVYRPGSIAARALVGLELHLHGS